MAYSEDFKQLVLKKLRQGWTIRRAAKEFGIAISTITLWKRPPAPQTPPKQRKTRKISAQALLEDVERYPDAYCYERAQRFGCSHTAIHKALKRYNISCKKRPTATRKPTEGSEKTS
ncbi:IS630 transposase-related protein [Neisseria yangbaofengii]|uniref:IS630 transposase-related protein n=1 Tax=Neisseria yangbaofengii TaxID=2709396 RepID=UPI001868264C|nr:IS630 transposase-related protein [Neisseria yangbaofengii]